MNPRLLTCIVTFVLALAVVSPTAGVSGQADSPHGTGDDVLPASQTLPVPFTGIQAIAAGGDHTCALTTEGGVKCWGDNNYGQLGDDNKPNDSDTPDDVVGLGSGVQAIAAGGFHTCALTDAGGVKCWGSNFFGQLGDGNAPNDSDTPVDVVGLGNGIESIAAGNRHTCALTTGGGVKCWGRNLEGQLGDSNAPTSSDTPVDVAGLGNGVQAIAAEGFHTCALTTGGGVKCCGSNIYGQLGDSNAPTSSDTPVDVVSLGSGAQAIAAGGYHTCALTDGGGVKCWGRNSFGQLGDDNEPNNSDTPVDVAGLGSGVQAVSGGYYHTCGLTTGGGVKCWGDNNHGQLGDNSTTDRDAPVGVVNLALWTDAVTAGRYHSCVLTTGNAVKCWGRNSDGQLGDGTTADRFIPGDVITTATCYKLTRSRTGQGGRPVAEPDHTPGCPADHYLQGQNIALFANANNGWRVNGWSGTSDNGALTHVNSLTMPAQDTTVSVAYARCRALTCNHDGQGGNPIPAPENSFNCAPGTYVAGQSIALIAKPDANQRVKAWSGTDTTPDAGALVNTLTMPDSARTVKATYEACNLLTAQVSGHGDPLSAVPVASVGCPAGRYAPGQSIVLTAAPAAGWTVEGWSGTSNDESSAATNAVVMPDGDHTVGVTYAEEEEPEQSLFLPAVQG